MGIHPLPRHANIYLNYMDWEMILSGNVVLLLESQTRVDPRLPRQRMRPELERKAKPSVPSKSGEGAATRKFKIVSEGVLPPPGEMREN